MIGPQEIEIFGRCCIDHEYGKKVDETCQRIATLVANHLLEVACLASGSCRLFRDPTDGRLWELIYLPGEVPGVAALRQVSPLQARWIYGYDTPNDDSEQELI